MIPLLPLHGILNNAGIGFGKGFDATLETNFYGARRVCDAFEPLLQPDGGRIVNVASASGPIYVAGLDDDGPRTAVAASPSSSPHRGSAAVVAAEERAVAARAVRPRRPSSRHCPLCRPSRCSRRRIASSSLALHHTLRYSA